MPQNPGFKKFTLVCATVFFGFLTIGLPLAVLPEQVHDILGFSAFIVGVVIGIQSFATVMTRHIVGTRADLGAQGTVRMGLWICSLAGVVYLASNFLLWSPSLSLAVLVIGRLILGLGESLLITGALTWGIGLVGPAASGQVMAWNGIAMYGALSFGAPFGIWIDHYFHFGGVSLAVILSPFVALFLTRFIPATSNGNVLDERESFLKIVSSIWMYGLGMGLGTIGFGALSTFIVLYFRAKGFGSAGIAMTVFGCAYVSVRLVAGHLPDKTGGRTIAIISLLVEAIGQALIWLAPNALVAYVGAAFVGFGFSLVFPAFGVQAGKNVPAHSRGAALGAFFAFFDIALGATGPLSGAVASLFGFPSVYLMGAIACLGGSAIAYSLRSPARASVAA